MSDDDNLMGVQFICNQSVVTYNNSRCMNLMGISDPWDNPLDIIAFQPVKNCKG